MFHCPLNFIPYHDLLTELHQLFQWLLKFAPSISITHLMTTVSKRSCVDNEKPSWPVKSFHVVLSSANASSTSAKLAPKHGFNLKRLHLHHTRLNRPPFYPSRANFLSLSSLPAQIMKNPRHLPQIV